MSKIRKILVCFMLTVVAVGLCSCGKGAISRPAKTDAVVGNGSSAVQKGEYLYFTNGYLSRDTITKGNRKDTRVNGAIYVTKLVNGKPDVDDTGALKSYDVIYDNIAGYEQTDLYIFGDYLYFTAPGTDMLKSGSVAKDKTVFYRIRLDKSGSLSSIYTTSNDGEYVEYAFYGNAKTVKLLVLERESASAEGVLYSIDASSKSKKKLASNVTSIYFPTARDNAEQDTACANNVYYTTSLTEDETDAGVTGNKLYHLNALTGDTDLVYGGLDDGNQETYKVVYADANHLYYEMTDDVDTLVYRASLSDGEIASTDAMNISSVYTYTKYLALTNSTRGVDCLIGFTGSAVHILGATLPEVVLENASDVLFANDQYLYYTDGSSIYRIDLVGEGKGDIETLVSADSEQIMLSAGIDFDDRYVYYYMKNDNSNYYLKRLDLLDTTDDGSGYAQAWVCVWDKSDVPEVEEDA